MHAARPSRTVSWLATALAVGVLGAAIAVVAVFAVQAIAVKNDLERVKTQLVAMVACVVQGEPDRVVAAGDTVLSLTGDAAQTVQGPLWDVMSAIPVVGPNVQAIRQAAAATDVVARGAMPTAVSLLTGFSPGRLGASGGGVDLTPVEDASHALPQIRDAIARASQQLAGIDDAALIPAVRDALSPLQGALDAAGPLLKTAGRDLPPLLDIAGMNGPRTYMLIFQNNAEARSGGGLPAATAIVKVDKGKIELAAQTGTYSFPRNRQVLDLPQETLNLYEPDTFKGFGNFTRTPNFPTTARAFDSLWDITQGAHLDGVISLDPVVLSNVLKVTGPLQTDDGRTLTSQNVVEALLYDAYLRYSRDVQDHFFADVASRAFAKIADADWSPTKMWDALQTSITQQRLHAWFARPDEQALAVRYKLDGAMATSNEKRTELGIFVNDAAYSKLEYFMKTSVNVTCNAAAGTVTTALQIANSVPSTGMTSYQLGIRNKRYGIPRQSFILDVMYFAPPGSVITGIDPEHGNSWYDERSGVEDGRDAHSIRVFVGQGETRTVSYTSTLPAGKRGPLAVRYSPTVTSTPVHIAPDCAGLFTQPPAAAKAKSAFTLPALTPGQCAAVEVLARAESDRP
ncbi:DUF4012 domain-containing protein [Microbacterium kribbense]|uniref:DUF4012 domain-containing protein n=1 Tax=Microbacterium kribbense TaxID=433645 RepID=A0ABP7GK05_9MICO